MKKNTKGFTLAEVLIVVAVIAVLVAISIPVFTSQLHKARVAADWANVRAYYAQLQYDFMETEKIDENKLREPGPDPITSFNLTGQKINLKAGYLYIRLNDKDGKTGYNFLYVCKNGDTKCELVLPED